MQVKRIIKIIKKKRDLSPLNLKTKNETKNKDKRNPRLLFAKIKENKKNKNPKSKGKNKKGVEIG